MPPNTGALHCVASPIHSVHSMTVPRPGRPCAHTTAAEGSPSRGDHMGLYLSFFLQPGGPPRRWTGGVRTHKPRSAELLPTGAPSMGARRPGTLAMYTCHTYSPARTRCRAVHRCKQICLHPCASLQVTTAIVGRRSWNLPSF